MWTFLSDLADHWRATLTVLVVNDEGVDPARRHQVRPRELGLLWGATIGATIFLTTCLIAFTPIRTLIPGYGTEAVQRSAQLSAMRVAALRDSLTVQSRYIERLQQLMTGRVEPRSETPAATSEPGPGSGPGSSRRPAPQRQRDVPEDHNQPAVAVTSFPASGSGEGSLSGGSVSGLPSLRMPLTPPVETGFPTRGFDARDGHYAVDIAVEAGSYVYSVGDGYVVFSDWTNDGGYTIAVQHADGYLSVYKHNQRLVKRVGDRVRQQEAIAISGNSGEITSGPHLHFELWRHGLAQDPSPLFEGW